MKVLAIILVLLAVVLIILPGYTDCLSQGQSITLANETQIPMKCHWTARAEIAIGIPVLPLGIALFFSRQKSVRRLIGILTLVMGAVGALLPTVLIGVCKTAGMSCNTVMSPSILLTCIGVVLVGILVFFLSLERKNA